MFFVGKQSIFEYKTEKMKIKLKNCKSFQCKVVRHDNRKKDRIIIRLLNKSIRQGHKKVCKSLGEAPFKATISYYYA